MEENTIDTTDRISMLPHCIIHHILSYLQDDPESLVRLSVLSKEWFSLTSSFPILNLQFYGEGFNSIYRKYDYEYCMMSFCKYVQYTVTRFGNQKFSAHTLNISSDIIDIEQVELFGRCLDLVLEKGLQVMDIHFKHYPKLPIIRLPNTLLSASTLTSLTLNQCQLPSSLMVGVVKFKSLRLLSLSHIPVDEGVIEYLTKGCPLLEEIYLGYCYGLKTLCVKRHRSLLKVEIYCDKFSSLLETIDVDAPNLSYFLLSINEEKTPSMFLGSCKKLTSFCYCGFPINRFNDFLSNFPLLENVSLNLSSHVDNLKLSVSHHFLRRLILQRHCDLEEIELNTPRLLLFDYYDRYRCDGMGPVSRNHSSLLKERMKYVSYNFPDILWWQKLRKFLEKNNIFNVLKLLVYSEVIDVEELKLIQLPPYELEHVKLKLKSFILHKPPLYIPVVDVLLRCVRPRSLTLALYHCTDESHVVKYTYKKLLQQEDEGQTNIKFMLFTSSEGRQHFSDLNLLLKTLSLDRVKRKPYPESRKNKITFIKEEVVKPPHCTECKSFGHSLNTCPKNVKEADLTAATMEELNEGFTEVIHRKNKGKMADQQGKSGHISGIRLNKPKPSLCRPKPVKENAHGKGSSTKPKEHGVAFTSNTKSSIHFNISNTFEALNSLDEDGNGLHAPNQRVPPIAKEG